jgi:hypothetical protein
MSLKAPSIATQYLTVRSILLKLTACVFPQPLEPRCFDPRVLELCMSMDKRSGQRNRNHCCKANSQRTDQHQWHCCSNCKHLSLTHLRHRVEPDFSESVVPSRNPKVHLDSSRTIRIRASRDDYILPHHHQSEVIRERVGDVEPFAGEILEPYLWVRVVCHVRLVSKPRQSRCSMKVVGTHRRDRATPPGHRVPLNRDRKRRHNPRRH